MSLLNIFEEYKQIDNHQLSFIDLKNNSFFNICKDKNQLGILPNENNYNLEHSRYNHQTNCGILLDYLYNKTSIFKNVHENIFELVKFSLLIHDIGHGPTSHRLEHILTKYNYEYIHEEQTIKIINTMNISDKDLICKIIKGKKIKNSIFTAEELFMLKLVSNDGIDLDRFEYLFTDSLFLNNINTELYEIFNLDNFVKNVELKNNNYKFQQSYINKFLLYRRNMYINYYNNKSTNYFINLNTMEINTIISKIKNLNEFKNFGDTDFLKLIQK